LRVLAFLFGEYDMQIINHWPSVNEIALPELVATEVINFLVEPFTNEQEAKVFWLECPSSIIILDETCVLNELDSQFQQQVSFCINNSEFEETLPNGYRLLLAIVSDDGAGCYLVLPSDFDVIGVIDG